MKYVINHATQKTKAQNSRIKLKNEVMVVALLWPIFDLLFDDNL